MRKYLIIIALLFSTSDLLSQSIYQQVFGLRFYNPDSLIKHNYVRKLSGVSLQWNSISNKYVKYQTTNDYYDKNGNLVKWNWKYLSKKITEKGHLNEKIKERRIITYQNKKIKRIKVTQISKDRNNLHYKLTSPLSKNFRSEILIQHEYDQNGRITSKSIQYNYKKISLFGIIKKGNDRNRSTNQFYYHYDSIGNLITEINENKSTTTYDYDKKSRLIRQSRYDESSDSIKGYEIFIFKYIDSLNSIKASWELSLMDTLIKVNDSYVFDDKDNMIEYVNDTGKKVNFILIKNENGLLIERKVKADLIVVHISKYKYKYY